MPITSGEMGDAGVNKNPKQGMGQGVPKTKSKSKPKPMKDTGNVKKKGGK